MSVENVRKKQRRIEHDKGNEERRRYTKKRERKKKKERKNTSREWKRSARFQLYFSPIKLERWSKITRHRVRRRSINADVAESRRRIPCPPIRGERTVRAVGRWKKKSSITGPEARNWKRDCGRTVAGTRVMELYPRPPFAYPRFVWSLECTVLRPTLDARTNFCGK